MQTLETPKSKTILRRAVIALAWIVTLVALFYGVEDWRGRRGWSQYKKNYEAHRGSLDFSACVPKEVPDADNFASTPFVQTWFTRNNESNLLSRDNWFKAEKLMAPNWRSVERRNTDRTDGRQFLDLMAWKEAFAALQSGAAKPQGGFNSASFDVNSRVQAAPAVLAAMQDDDAALQELREASARPEARYPVVYDRKDPWGILLPHLSRIKFTCLRLQVRAAAELAMGQSDQALEDVKLMLYLSDTIKTEPFLISYLVRIACLHIAVDVVWEGLAEHHWNDAQLQQLQSRLAAYDVLSDMKLSQRAERNVGVLTVDLMLRKGFGWFLNASDPKAYPRRSEHFFNTLGSIVPSGWFDLEKLHYCQGFDHLFEGNIDQTVRRVFPKIVDAKAAEYAESRHPVRDILHHDLLAALTLPSLTRIPIKAAACQCDTDEAAIACALERCRLAKGQLPEKLDDLVPHFIDSLPNDVIGGEPYVYRRLDDSRFILYSVGWNEKDDGGIQDRTPFDTANGDWVW